MPKEDRTNSPVATAASEYDRFAPIYNRWMAEDFCRRAWPAVYNVALCQLRRGANILDLCCGTGHMARALTEAGFRVTGIDASDEMLRFARGNAPGARFFRADARHFDLDLMRSPASFDLALSTFNSLAHLDTIPELSQVFANVRACLAPGAAFLFDLTMEEAYASRWRGSFALVADDHACIVQPSYDLITQTGTNQITIFELQDQTCESAPLYSRSEFAITQKCHSEADLRIALHLGGFSDIQCLDAEQHLHMQGESGRAFFLCR